jgi:hypothetical protein
MVRPRVARGFVDPAGTVLHQCIRPLLGACCAPGHHGYQRACDLISRQASTGPFGSPVFACAGKTDLHRRLILSQTSVGKLITSSITSHLHCSFVRARRPFLRPGLRVAGAPRARGRQGWPSRRPCLSLPCCQALTAPSTARGSRWRGRGIDLVAREGAPLVENPGHLSGATTPGGFWLGVAISPRGPGMGFRAPDPQNRVMDGRRSPLVALASSGQ